MSETLHIGDYVLLRELGGRVVESAGVGYVTASDLSHVEASFLDGTFKVKVNAGTLANKEHYLHLLSPEHHADLSAKAHRAELNKRAIADLECQKCRWWRPPFTVGPGNCHNSNLIALTRANDDGFPPPTPATFGCVHWETKEEPENGDNSDE